MVCVVCGREEDLEEAHVKPQREFDEDENDSVRNLISLCSTHHTVFDDNRMGICPDRTNLILLESDEIRSVEPSSNVSHIKDEYVDFRNQACDYKIRLALGMIDTQSWNKLC